MHTIDNNIRPKCLQARPTVETTVMLLIRPLRSRFTAALLAACLCAGAAAAADGEVVRDPYLLNPGDLLLITVWKEPELARETLVSPDGHLSFPLAGDMIATGKTVEQVRLELTDKLSRLIPDVVVSVSLRTLAGNRIYVLGQVNRPNEFIMAGPVDVMQALSMAGGPTPFAVLNDIKILRRGPKGGQVALPFKFKAVQDGDKLEQNILLRAGDTVVVP
jgi:polysaccharide export outer membrane protein